MPENLNPETQLEYLKELRRKYEEALSNAQKTGDYSEATKLKDELDRRLSALEALFPKAEMKKDSYEYLSNPENFSEAKALEQLEYYLSTGVSPGAVARTLACFNSEEAMKLRNKFQKMTPLFEYCEGIAGVDDLDSNLNREQMFQNFDTLNLVKSISGLDTDRAWQIREQCFRNSFEYTSGNLIMEAVALSLIGLNTDQAWEMRRKFIKMYPVDKGISSMLLQSLAGIDTEQAWDMRQKLYNITQDLVSVVRSVTGIDSAQAWDYRRAKKMVIDPTMVDDYEIAMARSLAGIDTEQAWDYRDAWYKTQDWQALLESLAGIDTDRASLMRNHVEIAIIKAKVWDRYKDYLPNSINGDFITAMGWRTAKKYNKEKED